MKERFETSANVASETRPYVPLHKVESRSSASADVATQPVFAIRVGGVACLAADQSGREPAAQLTEHATNTKGIE